MDGTAPDDVVLDGQDEMQIGSLFLHVRRCVMKSIDQNLCAFSTWPSHVCMICDLGNPEVVA